MKTIKARPITVENFSYYEQFTDLQNPEGYSLGDFYHDRVKIRCHDLFDGSTDFRGMKGLFFKDEGRFICRRYIFIFRGKKGTGQYAEALF